MGKCHLLGSSISPEDIGHLFSVSYFAWKGEFHHKNTEIDLKQLYVKCCMNKFQVLQIQKKKVN